VQLVDGLMPSDQSWVALGDGWMRNSIVHANISAARFVALHCSRPADLPAAGAAWKLLVRDCDVDKAHKRLEALGSAADSLHSSSGAHAVHGDAWQVVRNGCVPAGWRPASCWEGECCCIWRFQAMVVSCGASICVDLRVAIRTLGVLHTQQSPGGAQLAMKPARLDMHGAAADVHTRYLAVTWSNLSSNRSP
jgi:hypothetical protein